MKKWLLHGFLFFCSYLLFMVATIPAKSILTFINLPNNITLFNISGTIWYAKIARIDVAFPRQKSLIINNVETHLSVKSLLLLAPKIAVDFGDPLMDGPQGHIVLGHLLSKPSVEVSEINIFANEISQQLVLPVPVAALGKLTMKLDHYTFGKPLCTSLKANVYWKNAALTAFEQTVNLQTLQAQLTCKKGVVTLIINPRNILGLTFSVYLHSTARISGQGYLTPGREFPQPLQQILPFLGRPDNKGRYRLQF